jgi:hypothetical protein
VQQPHHTIEPQDPAESEQIVNFPALLNWLRLSWNAIRQRKAVVFGVAVTIFALGCLALLVMPKTYHVESRLSARRNEALATNADSGPLTRSAAEIVKSRDNLRGLVLQTRLTSEWSKRRAPILRFKDWLLTSLSRPPTEKELSDGLVGYLEKKLVVWADEGTVNILLDWPDGPTAYQLVEAAQQTFLEARHVQEVSTVAEAASILESHAAELRRQIDTAVAEIQRLQGERAERLKVEAGHEQKEKQDALEAQRKAALAAEAAFARKASTGEPPAVDEAVTRRLGELPTQIEAKQRVLASLTDIRERRLADLHAQLAEQRALYTDAHPVVTDIQQKIQASSQESPQVKQLRGEISGMKEEYERLKASLPAETKAKVAPIFLGGGAKKSEALPSQIIQIGNDADDGDPQVQYARAKLKFAIDEYQSLLGRIQKTRIELDTAQAGFKYRYAVVTPPEVPKGPTKPKPLLVILGALFGGLLVGAIAGIALELRGGAVRESWQIEDGLSLPVLATIELPAKASRRG